MGRVGARTRGQGLQRADLVAIVLVLVAGLYIDVRYDLPGQMLASLAAWAMFMRLMVCAPAEEARLLLLCVVIATAGELFLSLVWGLYTYRLDNVPMYVPPGHALLLALGFALARRMPERVTLAIMVLATAASLIAGALGRDTFGLILCAVFIACSLLMPARRSLFASTFVISLALELYGTWLGNWAWAPRVPWTPLTTTNPPLAAGAFYCLLDTLVVMAAARWPVATPALQAPQAAS